jgi:hypothetical protein
VHGGDFSHPNQEFHEVAVAFDEFQRENERESAAQSLPRPTRHTYYLEATPHRYV